MSDRVGEMERRGWAWCRLDARARMAVAIPDRGNGRNGRTVGGPSGHKLPRGSASIPTRPCLPEMQHRMVLAIQSTPVLDGKERAARTSCTTPRTGAGRDIRSVALGRSYLRGAGGISGSAEVPASPRSRVRHSPRPERGGGVASISRKVSARSQRHPVHHHGRRTSRLRLASLSRTAIARRLGSSRGSKDGRGPREPG